ncbi:phenolic acid decarboxylase [Kribbella sp. NPDC026596]
MAAFRDAGPTYPIEVVGEFATITYLAEPGPGDETVINCPPADVPEPVW